MTTTKEMGIRLPSAVSAMEIAPDGNTLIIGTERSFLAYHLPTRKKRWENRSVQSGVVACVVNRQGLIAAGEYESKRIKLLDIKTGRQIGQWDGHRFPPTVIVSHPDIENVISTGEDETRLYFWDAQKPLPLKAMDFKAFVQYLAISPKGDLLAVQLAGKSLRFVETTTWKTVAEKQILPQTVGKVCFAPTSSQIAYVVIVTEGGKVRHTIEQATIDPQNQIQPIQTIRGLPSFVQDMAFSSDGKYLATAHVSGVAVWDVQTGAKRYSIGQEAQHAAFVRFDPKDSTRIITGSSKGHLVVWRWKA